MYSVTTEGVTVEVESFYIPEQSDPDGERYVFGYRIAICNESKRTVQLLRRHWIITDGRDRVTEVHGDGVVGEQPVLTPGHRHTYESGSVMATPAGTMEGSYEMRDDTGRLFEVEIPRFLLAGPRALH